MGLFWKTVSEIPSEKVLRINGDPTSPPKRWDQLWRIRQKWILLKNCSFEPDADGFDGYALRFQSIQGVCMEYREWIQTPYIAARLGPEDIEFAAFYHGRHAFEPHELQNLGTFYGKGTAPDEESMKALHHKSLLDEGQVTYV